MLERFIEDVLFAEQHEKSTTVTGRVVNARRHGAVTFLDIADHTGTLQVVIEKKYIPEYKQLSTTTVGSYISAEGKIAKNRGRVELNAERMEVIAKADARVEPSPWSIDGTDPTFGLQVFGLPSFYIANPQRAAVLRIKTNFIAALHEYFQDHRFTLVEPPILTNKTLYREDNAIHATVHDESVFLSQCATFELEPMALAFGKVYTISPAFRNEPGGSKRHLAEYTHVKAEALLANIDDLMSLASDSLYHALKRTVEMSGRELTTLGKEIDVERIHRSKQEHITYDDALEIARKGGSTTEYGSGLTRGDEILITKHMGDKYVWMMFPPFASEGFPYRRHTEKRHLSMTCDLIAPHGAGEMVGVAEKTTSADELIGNLIEKGKKPEIGNYWEYIALRRYGLPPHGGIGAAPERIMYGLLGLDHIRLTKPWPRYPDRKINVVRDDLETFGDAELERLKEKYSL